MSSTAALVRARHDHLPVVQRWLILMLALAVLLFAPPVPAQDQQEVQLGVFHATGEWKIRDSAVTGKGIIEAPWGGKITITASYDDERGTGKWSGKFSHPVLGDVAVASGVITNKALTFDHKINVGAGTVVFDMTLTPEALSGEGQGTLKTGNVSFGKVALTFENDGILAASNAKVRLPGLTAPFEMAIKFEKTRFASATGTGKISLGPYTFSATADVTAGGTVGITAQQSQNLAGIGETQMTLRYVDGQLSATGTRTISLGQIVFDNTTVTLDKAGKLSLSKTSSVDLPGLGATQLTLNYANSKLTASGTRQVKLGNYAFDNTAIAVSSTGTLTFTKQASLSLPVVGATQMTLNYANGTFSATGSRTVILGNISFSNATIAIDSSGAVSISKTQSVNLPGIGATEMTLAYANGVLAASGSREIRLGSYGFSDVAISLDSTGAVSLSKQQSLSLPGIGATQMTLSYANGRLSATSTRTVSLGQYGFDNTAIVIDSSGVVAAQKRQSVNIPGIGSAQMSLTFVNGAFVASGVQTVRLGSYAFDQTTIEIDSSGHVAISRTQSQNLPVIGSTQLSLAYVDGVISASGSRRVSLGRFAFDNTAIAVSSSGSVSANKTQSISLPGIGSTQMTLSLANGTLSASGLQDVNLGQFAFSSAAVTIDSTGTVSVVKSQGFDLPGLGNTQLTLAYVNGVASASGSRSVSLGSLLFSDVAIAVDSTGKVTVNKQQTMNVPGIGNVALTLGYANGVVSANGTASIGVSVLGKSINFGSAAVNVTSSGNVSVSASQGVNIGPLHYNVSISYENGSIHVHY
jgi:hypothetical protein